MFIINGFKEAIYLLISLDAELYHVIILSLMVSLTAAALSSIMAVPIGILMGVKEFPLKKVAVRFIYTMMSVPPVIAGLIVFLLISRRGPLGILGLVYTPTAMIIAQTVLIFPIITGLVYNATKEKGETIQNLGKTLGANRRQRLILLVKELRMNILTAIITGYGRGISEVGAVMLVGGNIRGQTRTMTTTIAMLQSMGEYSIAIALGIILLLISFILNSILLYYQQGDYR
ncbi:ABC transporter permease [Alkaliphilus peptidifermentans]|uniref:Tungstate transport system permease protein n=1 Tax=Alkaliphilus peptidifermentans DSM 18978 TaxID=1120976 RepID=A0A1G5HG56_9FIRM|nr:ABC transporter permease [Alkaliphilus peptidifermentans]SCY62008.1 tungstate transport system permease protein [Alkaliphilus peptidifermentans DSM 18978]